MNEPSAPLRRGLYKRNLGFATIISGELLRAERTPEAAAVSGYTEGAPWSIVLGRFFYSPSGIPWKNFGAWGRAPVAYRQKAHQCFPWPAFKLWAANSWCSSEISLVRCSSWSVNALTWPWSTSTTRTLSWPWGEISPSRPGPSSTRPTGPGTSTCTHHLFAILLPMSTPVVKCRRTVFGETPRCLAESLILILIFIPIRLPVLPPMVTQAYKVVLAQFYGPHSVVWRWRVGGYGMG